MTCCCFATTFPKVSSFSCKKKNVLLVNPWQGMTSKQEKRHWLIGTAIIRFLLVKHTPKKSASTFIFIYIRLQLLIFCCGFLRHPGEISLGKQGDTISSQVSVEPAMVTGLLSCNLPGCTGINSQIHSVQLTSISPICDNSNARCDHFLPFISLLQEHILLRVAGKWK